jgi:hypothetical protein
MNQHAHRTADQRGRAGVADADPFAEAGRPPSAGHGAPKPHELGEIYAAALRLVRTHQEISGDAPGIADLVDHIDGERALAG